MFKKTKIAAATVALLSAAAMQNASAVAIDESGTNAQVLIFPYYNTNGSFITGFNIRNTKDEYKVVKMRFRESKLSNDVLDFNVYLSPFDHFSVGLSTNAAGHAVLATEDKTCTDPAIPAGGVELKGDVYTNTNFDDAREGYVEVIEIGNVKTTATVGGKSIALDGILHKSNVPGDCTLIEKAWGNGSSYNAKAMTDLSAPTGGLQGWSFLLDAAKGNANVAMPVAIRNYTTSVQHYRSSDTSNYLLPSLASGSDNTSVVMNDAGTGVVTKTWAAATDYTTTDIGKQEIAPNTSPVPTSGTNPYPIAHVLAATGVANDYLVTDSGNAAGTDWVLTFPMRKHGIYAYQNAAATAGDVTMSSAKYFNREEAIVNPVGGFSPATQTPPEALPREVNIITFGKKGQPGTSVLGSKNAKPIGVDYLAGWGMVALSASNKIDTAWTADKGAAPTVGAASITTGFQAQATGVPVIGFAALRGNAPTNIIGESVPHVFTRSRGN